MNVRHEQAGDYSVLVIINLIFQMRSSKKTEEQ